MSPCTPPPSKRTRTRTCPSLESLPDDILVGILSFLPAQDAVRTCLLSRRWNRLWASATHLNLDVAFFRRPGGFTNFVTRMLRARGERPIHSLSLSFNHRVDDDRVADWLNNALLGRCGGLRKLDLYAENYTKKPLDYYTSYSAGFLKLPDSVFTSSSLTELVLRAPFMALTWPTSSSMPALKKLNLTHVHLARHGRLGDTISSCCPALEKWIVTDCDLPEVLAVRGSGLESFELRRCRGVVKLDVMGPQLRRVVVECCFSGKYPDRPATSFKISAPRLESLTWDDCEVECFDISDLNSLVCAEVRVRMEKATVHDVRQLEQLMYGLSTVTKLRAKGGLLKHLGIPEAVNLRQDLYGNLRNLELESRFGKHDLLGMSYLLRCCPELETLVIANTGRRAPDSPFNEEDSLKKRDAIFCKDKNLSLNRLRTVKIQRFSGTELEMDFIGYLLDVPISLKEITLVPHPRDRYKGMETAKRLIQVSSRINISYEEYKADESRALWQYMQSFW